MSHSPIKKLETEIGRLRALYSTSVYSYARTRKEMQQEIYSGSLDPEDPVLINPSDPTSVAANNGYAFLSRMKSQFPRYLRETIFVRLISALEVFIVDAVRELFMHRRDLFHTNETFEFSQREILAAQTVTKLWTKIINKELRTIQNQGFKKTVRYFDKRLGIDLGSSPTGLRTMEELHDRRHLLVHRLGRADSQYKHAYNVTKRTLTIEEPYLLDAFDHVFIFAEYLWNEAKGLIEQASGNRKGAPERVIQIEIETKNDDGASLIRTEFHFESDDRIIALSELITGVDKVGDTDVFTLAGESATINDYIKRLRKAAKKGDLVIHHGKNVRGSNKAAKCRLPRDQIESIARLLPEQPWPQGIHKQIANEQGISNSQASGAISVILTDPELLALVGAKTIA